MSTIFAIWRGPTSPAATFHQVTGGPDVSPRYRDVIVPQGLDDEMRVVFRAGGHPWGIASLWRQRGQRQFSVDETELAASLSVPLGEILRTHSRRSGPTSESQRPDRPEDSLVSVNEEDIRLARSALPVVASDL